VALLATDLDRRRRGVARAAAKLRCREQQSHAKQYVSRECPHSDLPIARKTL
jgi:hypothetical protein